MIYRIRDQGFQNGKITVFDEFGEILSVDSDNVSLEDLKLLVYRANLSVQGIDLRISVDISRGEVEIG